MAMRAFETERRMEVSHLAIIRQIDILRPNEDIEPDMDAFMGAFDHAVTVGDRNEGFGAWARRNKVDLRLVDDQSSMMMSFIGLSAYIRDPFNRSVAIESAYDVSCYTHNGEDEYNEFVMFLLTQEPAVSFR